MGAPGRIRPALLLLAWPALLPAQQIAMADYAVPTPTSGPNEMATGPDGALWFTEFNGNKIGCITTAGSLKEYAVPTPDSLPDGLIAGPDGALWFTEFSGNKIGRITLSGAITEYRVPTPASSPAEIATGPDGALWFTEYAGNKIGRITVGGAITEFPVPTANSAPHGITTGQDGALWFTEHLAGKIGRITTAGILTEFVVTTPGSYPAAIVPGPDGALWFAEHYTNRIGRITTSGAITEFVVPTPNSYPVGITVGPDAALWFTEYAGDKLGRITTGGAITEYPVPTPNSAPLGIVTGPDGELWFAEYTANQIGEAVFLTANLSVTPAAGSFGATLTFTGTGYWAGERVQIYSAGVGSAVLANATADASGTLNATAKAPASPYGPRIFLGKGQSSGNLGAAPFSVSARLTVNPNSGTAGTTAVAQGSGFGAGDQVKIYWNQPRALLGTATADVHGTFSGSAALTFNVPAGALAGPNEVVGVGQTTSANAPFNVLPSATELIPGRTNPGRNQH